MPPTAAIGALQPGTPTDEGRFVGFWEKASILEALDANVFFDNQDRHVLGTADVVPSGFMPGPHQPESR